MLATVALWTCHTNFSLLSISAWWRDQMPVGKKDCRSGLECSDRGWSLSRRFTVKCTAVLQGSERWPFQAAVRVFWFGSPICGMWVEAVSKPSRSGSDGSNMQTLRGSESWVIPAFLTPSGCRSPVWTAVQTLSAQVKERLWIVPFY